MDRKLPIYHSAASDALGLRGHPLQRLSVEGNRAGWQVSGFEFEGPNVAKWPVREAALIALDLTRAPL